MFARVSTYALPHDQIDQAVESFDQALTGIAECRGLDNAFFLVSRERDVGVAITFWEDGDCLAASAVTATRLRNEAIRAVDGEVLSVGEFTVEVRTGSGARTAIE